MKKNEMQYPELGRYPLYWTAIAERRNVVVNDYLDAELLQEKANELRDNPVILLTQKAARILECGPVAVAHGESFGGNVRDLVSVFKRNDFIHLAVYEESGKYREVLFDSCMYGNKKGIHAVEISLLGEWQEDAFRNEPECSCSQPDDVQHHTNVMQSEPVYGIDHGC
jgi:hypothetical protein